MIELRIILVLIMFVIASYTDVKERKSYDLVPIGFGISGVVLYLFDWQEFSGFDYFTLILNITILIAICKAKVAQGDIFLAIALSVLIPSIGPIPIGITVWLVGMVIGQFSGNLTCYNRNRKELKNNPDLFKEFSEESKLFLKFKFHINNNHKFVTPIVKETVFGKTVKEIDVSDNSIEMNAKQGQFVKPLIPGVPYMMGVFSFLIILNYLKNF